MDTNLDIAPTLQEVGLDIKEAYERGRIDFNFFASLAIPETYLFPFPTFYLTLWQILTAQENFDLQKLIRFALGLPRGHAKTTFIKVLVAWLIVYDKVRFVLVVCATEPLAEQLLSDIHDILGSSNIELIYGDWLRNVVTDRGDLKKAMYHGRPMTLAAKGAGSSLRGLNIKNNRPDFILCDDAQTRENDESEAERARLMRWLVATLFKCIDPRGSRTIVYIGNMYSELCILRQFQQIPQWISLITGAILSDGTTLWPQLHSFESLMESYFHDEALGLGSLWFAEVMNDPINPATSLLHDDLPRSTYTVGVDDFDASFITIDPAGFKTASDDNVIAVHHVADGKGHVVEILVGNLNPEDLIVEALKLAIVHNVSLIAIEDVAYQQSLQFWAAKYIEAWDMQGLVVVPVNPHGRTKEARIRQFIQELYAENYYLSSAEVRAAFVWQALKYKIGAKKNKDDLLDACAYGLDVRNEYWQLLQRLKHDRIAETNRPRVIEDNTPF